MRANLLAVSVLLLLVTISITDSQEPYRQPYGYGDCQKSFIVGVDWQKSSAPIGLDGFNIYLDGIYRGSTDRDGRLQINAYGGQHIINASKPIGSEVYSGSWSGLIECYYPAGGMTYVPVTINSVLNKDPVQQGQYIINRSIINQSIVNIPQPKNLEDILIIVGIALALIIGIVIVLRSIRYFLVNAILGLLVLYLANAFVGLNIAYTWLVVLVCAIGGIAGAIIVIILHIYGIIL